MEAERRSRLSRSESDEDAAAPMVVLVSPRPALEPPAARLEEEPLLAPAEDEPAPSAVLLEPLPAVAPPTPRLEDEPAFDP